MKQLFFFIYGMLTVLLIVIAVLFYEGTGKIPEFLSDNAYNTLWHCELAHTFRYIRIAIASLWAAFTVVFIYSLGKGVDDHHKENNSNGNDVQISGC